MEKRKAIDVNTVITMACIKFGYEERKLRSNEREAIKKKIRRCMGDLGWTRPYRLTETEAERLLSTDLRAYFLRAFAMPEEASEAKLRQAQAKQALKSRAYYRDHVDPNEYEDRFKSGTKYGISETEFNCLRSKAIFRRLFPNFDEKQFLKDYCEHGELDDYLGSVSRPDRPENLALEMRLQELSDRLKPALDHGDIDAYLVTEGDE